MSTLPTVIAILLGIAFLGAGGTKVANVGPHEQEFERYGLPGLPPQSARVAVGVVELVAAVLLLLAAITSSGGLAVVGAIIVLAAMIGAVVTHLRLGDAPPQVAPAGLLGILAIVLLLTA